MVDETCARDFTAWEDFGIERNDVVKISNCYIRIWQGIPQINFGITSKVEKLDTGILDQMSIKDLGKPVLLAEIENGTVAVHTKFRIIECEQQKVHTRRGPRTIIHGIGADVSAKLPFTSWISSPELVKENTVEIKNAQVRSWQGIPTINIGEFTVIQRSDIPITEDNITRVLNPATIRLINIMNRDGAFDVIIEGSIISVRSGSGLIIRCPECNRVIQKNLCRIHGTVEGRYDLRIKSILDDGTGVLTIVLNADLTKKVTGFSIEKAIEVASASITPSAVEDEIGLKLLNRTMCVRGNMTRGEYGITMVATDAKIIEMDTAAEAASLIKEMESFAYHSSYQEDGV